MIIDIRVRPPFKSIKAHYLFNTARRKSFARRFGLGVSPSIVEKSMDLFIQEMDEADITKAVVPMRKYPAGGSAGMNNHDLNDLMTAYPERFIGFAGIDPLDGAAALAEIRQFVLEGSCSGILLEPGYCQEPLYLTDSRKYPIYEFCQVQNIPILLSFGGFVAPNSDYNRPTLVNRVAGDFPDLRLTLAHGGWPFTKEICHIAYNWKNVYISPDIYAINVPGCNDYFAAANYFVPEKVIFGSAYPVLTMKDTVDYYREHVSSDHIEQVMYQNALHFLGIEDEGAK